jgi:SAM-dependent methyltransferase
MVCPSTEIRNLYHEPAIYEAAFSWRDYEQEVTTLTDIWKHLSKAPFSSVLEIACGPASHCEYFENKGIRYHGFDNSSAMIEYAQKRSKHAHLWQDSISSFQPPAPKVSCVVTFLGALYLRDGEELQLHLHRVHQALVAGGLYIMDWCVLFDSPENRSDSWSVETAQGVFEVSYTTEVVDVSPGLMSERLNVVAKTATASIRATSATLQKLFSYDEMVAHVTSMGCWEIVGCWNNWDLSSPALQCERVTRPLLVLRAL